MRNALLLLGAVSCLALAAMAQAAGPSTGFTKKPSNKNNKVDQVQAVNPSVNASGNLMPAAAYAGSENPNAPTNSAEASASTPGWKKVSEDKGIKTFRKDIPGSDIVAFRGEGMIDASIAKVAGILIDTPRKQEWVAKIVEAKDVRDMGPYERVEYNHTASGFFLVRDRDFVFHAKAEFDKPNNRITFNMQSVEDSLMPESDCCVRGYLGKSAYTLTAIDGNHTYAEVEIHADPKGGVPNWLVNLFQKSWPRTTLENMRAQAAKSDVAEHAGVKTYFDGPATGLAHNPSVINQEVQVAERAAKREQKLGAPANMKPLETTKAMPGKARAAKSAKATQRDSAPKASAIDKSKGASAVAPSIN